MTLLCADNAAAATGVEPNGVLRQLNQFLCAEIAAEVAYRMTAERLADSEDSPYLGLLRQFQEEHGLAGESLRSRVAELGGEVADVAGSLGVWGPAAKSSTTLFGNRSDGGSTLQLVRDAELHMLEDYCAAVPSLDPESAQLAQNLFIPTQRRHVRMLNELLG